LRKLSAYFLLRRWDFLERSQECFSVGNTHRTLCTEAPDAGLQRPVCCRVQQRAPDAPERVRCLASGVRAVWRSSLRMSPMSTGRSGYIRWLASGDPASLRSCLHTCPVCTGRVRCGLVERPVVLCRRACAVAVGGNGRLQTASDT